MSWPVKFSENQRQSCDAFIRQELAARGVAPDAIEPVVAQLRDASTVPDLDDDRSLGSGTMGFMRMRMCWVIRDEDLDIIGSLAKYAAPMAAGAAAVASATGAGATAPLAAAIAGALAFIVNVFLNVRRKGVTLDPMALCALSVLKRHPSGTSADNVCNALQEAVGREFAITEVGDLLASLAKAQMDASGTSVALAFERDGLWFRTV